MRDALYDQVPFRMSELPHLYGPHIHLVGNPFLLTQLCTLCAKGVVQPEINRLVRLLYSDLVKLVINAEYPRKLAAVPTRMIDSTPQGIYQGQVIDPDVRTVVVNIARAGTLPSQVTYDLLNNTLNPALVRQDHIIMSRMIDDAEKVVGSSIGGAKIGGDIDDAVVLFPDPMGATGSSLSHAIRMYKDKVPGTPKRIICLNLIITPEYLRRMKSDHPDAIIYALRLDRGLSPPEVFGTPPGTHWDKERGLDDRHYIVPGGGGFGEIMNNAFV